MVSLSPHFTPRLYQETIFSTASGANTLVVLPTGLGKTAIAAMMTAHRLSQYPESKMLFLAPTKPLVQQHLDTFTEFFPNEKSLALFTGHVKPEKRAELWNSSQFIFSTPQGLENDIISRKISLENVSLLVLDEAHRATGEYAYVYIAEQYHNSARHERILALTASPGSDEESIKGVCETLFIDALEVRSEGDADVAPYTQELNIIWEKVTLSPELLSIQKHLHHSYEQKLHSAMTLGVISGSPSNYNKTTLLKLQSSLMAQTAQGDKSYEVLKTVSLIAESLKLQHALELCETQTVGALVSYLHSLQKQARTSKTKAVQNVVSDVGFKTALILAEGLLEKGIEHPKIARLQDIVTKKMMLKNKLIIFTQFRDTALAIQKNLTSIAHTELFVGQAKKGSTGLSQKKQKEMIERFREGEFPVLIATSVAEEGLDIPAVDAVIFYEPIPSAIRTVQRRGRTARHDSGEAIVLVAEGTRDEGYRWSAHHKEKRMYRNLKNMVKTFKGNGVSKVNKSQTSLESYEEKELVTIVVDHREKGSAVMKSLLSQGAQLDLQQLRIGDYHVGDAIVEYKTVKDFVDSIIDGRLLSQLREMRGVHKPIIIIEGQEDLYAQRRIQAQAVRGMLATIVLNYQIPVLRTVNAADTAGVLLALARRQSRNEKHHQHHNAKPWSLKSQQEYLVSALPGIGTGLAQPLLEHFGSVRAVMNASIADLQKVEKIGKKKAENIREVLDEKY